MKGPAPKEDGFRRPYEKRTTLEGEPVKEIPELPNAEKYCELTLKWWDTWLNSPQSKLFSVTDWQRLMMLAPIVDQYWTDADLSSNQRTGLMAEIRLNEERLGATIRDRQSLRWDIELANAAPLNTEKMAQDELKARRERLQKALEG